MSLFEWSPDRVIVLWCPDWPVIAAAVASGTDQEQPIALIANGVVFACSGAARVNGVRLGLRLREAQSRCPELIIQSYDDATDHRMFEPVIRAVEAAVPGVQVIRPGTLAVRARGAARYYGGERAAATTLADIAVEHGAPGTRAGVADTLFAAERAAKAPPVIGGRVGGRIGIVPAGESAAFLSPMPVDVLGEPDLAMVLGRLGVTTLGAFAAFTDEQVRDRFGHAGVFLHRLAGGRDPRDVTARDVPPNLRIEAAFEPPLERTEQVGFSFRRFADTFTEQLRAAGLVATAIRIDVTDARGGALDRVWAHPRCFDAAEVVDRVRWQLGGGSDPAGLAAPVVSVAVDAEAVDAIGNHERGLWGEGPDDRVGHSLSRVQSMVGHDGVVTARIGGGRTVAERRMFVPWGDTPTGGEGALAAARAAPWPGQLPGPPPSTVFEHPMPADIVTGDGITVTVDERGALSGDPDKFRAYDSPGGVFSTITAWAGPWPLVARWWDSGGKRLHRMQVVDAGGRAWYLLGIAGRWWAEAVAI